MDTLAFIASLLDTLVWPAVVVIGLVLFRNQLRNLLPRVRLKHGETEIGFLSDMKERMGFERDHVPLKSVEPVLIAARPVASVQRGLKLVLDRRVIEKNTSALAQIKSRLKPGKGEIRFVLPLGDRSKEVELSAAGRYDVSPAMAGILSTLPGVSEVLEI